MSRSPTLQLLLSAIAISLSCGGGGRPASDAVVEQLQVRLAVRDDGAIDVRETIKVRAFIEPSPFERHLRRRRVDRFDDVRAAIVDAPAGRSAARIDIDRWGDVQVRWPDVSGEQGRTLELQYRMVGALEIHGTRAWVLYVVVPLAPAYPVAEARVEVEFPKAAQIIKPPSIAGWTLVHTPHGATATRTGITPGEPAALWATVDIGALTILLPTWQQNADRAREMAPAFLAGAFFILVIGLGAVIMVWVQYPKQRTVAGVRSSVRQAANGLVGTGLVVLVIAVAAAAGAALAIERYGRPLAAIPISIAIVGVLMLGAGLLLRRRRAT